MYIPRTSVYLKLQYFLKETRRHRYFPNETRRHRYFRKETHRHRYFPKETCWYRCILLSCVFNIHR